MARQSRTNSNQTSVSRTSERKIRQAPKKPLKLGVDSVKAELEKQLGKEIKLKWVRHTAINYHEDIGWQVVSGSMRGKINRYTEDGRLKPKSENIQDAEGGAYTALVGKDEYNFLMYKDLEAYLAEDAVWNKDEADRPMYAIQNASEMGERAGLGGDVESYQPKQSVKIEKKSNAEF